MLINNGFTLVEIVKDLQVLVGSPLEDINKLLLKNLNENCRLQISFEHS